MVSRTATMVQSEARVRNLSSALTCAAFMDWATRCRRFRWLLTMPFGRPKGIVNSQRNLLQRVAQSINAAHVNAEDRFLTLASLSTIVGVRDTITALLAGSSIHLLETQRAGAREILNVIRAEAITILFAFPALLRSVIAGGE